MGKGALIMALAGSFLMLTVSNTTLLTTRETQDVKNRASANMLARDLALKGRKLVLTNWVASSAKANSSPFQTLTQDGGTISVTGYTSANNVLDVTVRAEYDGAVHDVRSRYQWNNFGLNPFQVKAAEINFDISPATTLDFDKITIDDQALQELNDVLIDDLNLAGSLGDLNLGSGKIKNIVEDELSNKGKAHIGLEIIDQAQRDILEQENGMYFPDQVEQSIAGYLAANPGLETTINDGTSVPSSFGTGTEVLRIKDDFTVSGDFSGSGILIVEGSMNVPSDASFNWDGLVVIKPPSSNLNPQINFAGEVNLNGGLVALHEAMPNSGHMDVTTFRDMSGYWSSPSGVDKKLWYWPWCMYHKHDFTSAYGNAITYHSSVWTERIHENEIHLYDTLKKLSGTDEVLLEIYNPAAHGRGVVTIELSGEGRTAYPAAAGFDPSIASAGNAYRTRPFKVSDLEYFHIDVNRLSSLKKMWDSESNYPGCYTTSGPVCVGSYRSRMGALTFRLYRVVSGSEFVIYEASMYWHRRTDEEEAFNDKMDQLLSDIQSPSYGLDITFGNNVSIAADDSALSMLSSIGGGTMGLTHMGSWQTHWDPGDGDNPVTCGNYTAYTHGTACQ